MCKKIDRQLRKYSKEYTKALSKIVDSYTSEEEASHNSKFQFKCKKKVMILVCIVIVALSLTACWKPISKFTYEIYDKYISIIFVQNEIKDIKIEDIQIGYIPDNFVLDCKQCTENSILYSFYNEANNADLSVLIEKLDDGTEKGVDIENAEFVADPNRFVANKNGYVVLCISKKNISVEINGKISIDEAVKIAKNIKFYLEEK